MFQAPRQPIALQQVNLWHSTKAAVAVRIEQRSGDRSQGLGCCKLKFMQHIYFTTSGPDFSVVRRFEGKTQEEGVGHGHDSWVVLHDKFDGFSRETVRAAYRKMETVKMQSDENPDNFISKKNWCRDRLNAVDPKEGPSNRQYEDTIFHRLPPVNDRIRQIHFDREDCNLADIRHSAGDVEDLRRQPRPLQLRLVKRHRGTRHRRASDRAGPP